MVDFGTATNIEVIDARGCFIGGIIAPGVETSASALFSHATRLAATELGAPPAPVGTSTEEAIQSGIVFGEAGRVDGLIERVFEQIGRRCPVVATGGPRLAGRCSCAHGHRCASRADAGGAAPSGRRRRGLRRVGSRLPAARRDPRSSRCTATLAADEPRLPAPSCLLLGLRRAAGLRGRAGASSRIATISPPSLAVGRGRVEYLFRSR